MDFMKAEINEYEGCFSIDLEAETKEEAVKMARFGIGKLKRLRSCSVIFSQAGYAGASIVIGKNQQNSSTL